MHHSKPGANCMQYAYNCITFFKHFSLRAKKPHKMSKYVRPFSTISRGTSFLAPFGGSGNCLGMFFGRRNSYRRFEWFPDHHFWRIGPLGELISGSPSKRTLLTTRARENPSKIARTKRKLRALNILLTLAIFRVFLLRPVIGESSFVGWAFIGRVNFWRRNILFASQKLKTNYLRTSLGDAPEQFQSRYV